MKVLVTGAGGFIGQNLSAQLEVRPNTEVLRYGRHSSLEDLERLVREADFVCHLAGVNRPDEDAEFRRVNTDLTATLCRSIEAVGRSLPIIFASSVHVEKGNSYGISKLEAEQILLRYSESAGTPVYIFRLPHVVGKWCRPNYNSVVATFCYNIARDLPIVIHDPDYELQIVYIDDLVDNFSSIINGDAPRGPYCSARPSYPITVGELAAQLRSFRDSRTTLLSDRVGSGLTRALYATYTSYLPVSAFAYQVASHADPRGVFAEVLRTHDSGQFSFFTAHPGVTRGGHYHHTKTEKFLVLKGSARFRFRNILTNDAHEMMTSGQTPTVVETIPGWAHDITNVGDDELVVMLWANEVFDRNRPDTFPSAI